MTLNSSGPISLAGTIPGQSIELELGGSGSTTISLLDPAVRTLAGVPSGPITMPTNFYGKSNNANIVVPVTSNQVNMNLRTYALANGWDGNSAFQLTVNSGVYIYSTSTSIPAITIDGSWPNGVAISNNGYIIGQGGAGGIGIWNRRSSVSGNPGGTAISLGVNATIVNNTGAYIAGGGGGGAGTTFCTAQGGGGGGGAGGGAGGNEIVVNGLVYAGGAGGGVGLSGSPGILALGGYGGGSGGGGGRILPGIGGAGGSTFYNEGIGGGSGGGGATGEAVYERGAAGAGGSAGNVGGNGSGTLEGGSSGGGGGWGASGGVGTIGGGSAGSGGKAIALNGFAATRSGSGITYGAVS
jgi:hypothetical protein